MHAYLQEIYIFAGKVRADVITCTLACVVIPDAHIYAHIFRHRASSAEADLLVPIAPGSARLFIESL